MEFVARNLCERNERIETGLMQGSFVDLERQRGLRLSPDVAGLSHAAVCVVVSTRGTAVGPPRATAPKFTVKLLLADLVPPTGSLC